MTKLNDRKGRTVRLRVCFTVAVSLLVFSYAVPGRDTIIYSLRIPAPSSQIAEVQARFPTRGHESVDLMLPIWSPGFYRVEDYASRIQNFRAKLPDGTSLTVEKPAPNRWRIAAVGAKEIVVSYNLLCNGRSVTTNWLGENLLVLNAGASLVALVDGIKLPHEVRLEMPSGWEASSGLEPLRLPGPRGFSSPDYDTLVDSPIIAGKLSAHSFHVAGSQHVLVNAGDFAALDEKRTVDDIKKIVIETNRYWGRLPFKRYVFLNVFRQGGGGLEHSNSTLLTSSPAMKAPTLRWLSFVSHEYFHAFNVKRLRPVELSTFDYERPPTTSSLWISEGLTTYGADLIVSRAGLCKLEDCLGLFSSNIRSLQTSPGRLKQTLSQASLDVWTSGTSGVGRDPQNLVSYYVKGPVIGFLLDARIQRVTGGRKSLDDVMRLALKRYGGKKGFTANEFREVADEISGSKLRNLFTKWLDSTEELDYSEALDWFGLEFVPARNPAESWKLAVRANASAEQKAHLGKWLGIRFD